MNSFVKWIKSERIFSWIVFFLFLGIVVRTILISGVYYTSDYRSYGISEWLINYEGGFVRRGIIGQLLYYLEQLQLFDVRTCIMYICIILSIIILCLTLQIFRKEGWAILILPTGFIFGFTLFSLWGRKDFLSLLLTFLIYISFRSIITYKRRIITRWVIFYFLSTFQLLIHEASFFYSFPILTILLYQNYRNHLWTFSMSCLACFFCFLPILIVMSAVCLYKGDIIVAETIWNSWRMVFESFPSEYGFMPIGEGVGALSWEATKTFTDHLYSSYVGHYTPSYTRIPIVLLNFIATYYIVSRVNTVNMGLYPPKKMNNISMSNIVLIQFAAMLPMYTFLSCDWGRTIPYWVISSLYFYHVFNEVNYEFPKNLSLISRKIQLYISGNSFLSSQYTYILAVFLIPIPRIFAPFDFMNTFQWYWVEEFIRKIHHF